MQRQQFGSFPHGVPQSGVAERCRRSDKALLRAAASPLRPVRTLVSQTPQKEGAEKIGIVSIITVDLALPSLVCK